MPASVLTGAAVGAGVGGRKGAPRRWRGQAAAGVAIGQEQERRRAEAERARYYDDGYGRNWMTAATTAAIRTATVAIPYYDNY